LLCVHCRPKETIRVQRQRRKLVLKREEGKVEVVDGYQVWHSHVGGGIGPLLPLHGGPRAGHDYLGSLEALKARRRDVGD